MWAFLLSSSVLLHESWVALVGALCEKVAPGVPVRVMLVDVGWLSGVVVVCLGLWINFSCDTHIPQLHQAFGKQRAIGLLDVCAMYYVLSVHGCDSSLSGWGLCSLICLKHCLSLITSRVCHAMVILLSVVQVQVFLMG